MKHCIRRIWCEDEGVLTFEWVLLVTLLTIGVVSGLAAARDAVIDELGDVAQAMMSTGNFCTHNDDFQCIGFVIHRRV